MGKWLELVYTTVSKTVGLYARASSNLALPTILIIFLISIFCKAQDQDEHNKVELAENQRLLRPELQDKLCKLMLQRYMSPFNEWKLVNGPMNIFTWDKDTEAMIFDDIEHWFILLIKPVDKFKGQPIWIKFYLASKEVTGPGSENYMISQNDWIIKQYIENKGNGLTFQLEQAFITRMHDVEFHEAIIHGEAHLWRLVSKDTKIEDIRKMDLVY